jgi:hypothetical protein
MKILDTPSSFLDVRANASKLHAKTLRVDRVDSLSKLESVTAEWERVQDNCAFRHVLLDHRWLRSWWNSFGRNKELHGLLFRDGSEMRGIVPMVLSRGWEAWPSRDGPLQIAEDHANLGIPKWRRTVPVRRVTFPLNIPSLNARGHALVTGEPEAVCSAVLRYWSNHASEWDVMVLEGLPSESGQREAFMESAEKEGLSALPSGRIRLMYRADLSGGMDAYIARRSSHFRKRWRQQINQCRSVGDLDLAVFRGPNIRRGLNIMFDIERHTWKANPGEKVRMRVPLDDELRRFLMEVGVAFASSDDAVVHVMSLNGKPVGAIMGLSRQQVMLSLLIYLRDDAREIINASPLMDAFIRDAIAHGMTELDINGVTEYARRWATHEDRYQRLYIFNRHPRSQFLRITKALATNMSQLSRSVERNENES